ncbi:hypothetical protein B14911_13792 [Bacillus sp. NRRL B-14911]|nr:hypothetical protein B14911_13792 [Bacillus sp. NRRL B-14911]
MDITVKNRTKKMVSGKEMKNSMPVAEIILPISDLISDSSPLSIYLLF